MKRPLTLLIIVMASLIGGCSFSTDYVVVNSSGALVQVTYTIAPTTIAPLAATGVGIPAMLPESELSGREWRRLSEAEFRFDRANRTVTVLLPPNHGLLINRGGDYRPDLSSAGKFIIQEIRITGSSGEIIWKGDAVRKAFAVQPKPFYSFGPPTLLTLTYQ